MKFGKQILSQQISGWGAYYLDYKFLKKIINSLEKGRLGDAALFATGVRPDYIPNGEGHPASHSGQGTNAQILPQSGGSDELQAHKAAFFFKLERELEKINAFYLQKEAELKVRLRTLIDKRKLIFQARNSAKLSKDSPSFVALYEGFRYFEKDLSKLQQFIEINATGFRKILKKWDKRSKSQTKELYLARQVEVQPCFNREFIAELSDVAAANLLELENLSDGRLSRNGDADGAGSSVGDISSEKRLDFAAARSQEVDALSDLEANLTTAITSGREAVARDMIRVASQSQDRTSIARIIWRALLEAPREAVQLAMASGLPDYGFVDDINSRTCLHQAALAGKLQLVVACVQNGVDVAQRDIYGRAAISYAAMSGHADVCTYLLSLPAVDPATVDLDGFSPLVLAVMNGRSDVVRILLQHGVSVEPQETTDLIPLCLACQGGHTDMTRLLLERGAKVTANAEGLTPQALAAREGHAGCLRLLMAANADRDVPEKGTLWTPLFFAAENGHVECLQVLIDAGCKVDTLDEKARNPAFYAAWNGKIECLLVLLQAMKENSARMSISAPSPSDRMVGVETRRAEGDSPVARKKSKSDEEMPDLDLDGEIDGIPSLSLPPPIIPFRTYGHNYLDKRALVSVSLSNSSVKLYKHQDPNRPEQFSTSSLKLVMTSRPDASATTIPHNIVLPLADDREVFSFQVDSLEKFSIEWELMPTFGSKVIGKAVALPSSFEGMTDRKRFVLPLQDVYLKVVGEVSFELDFVKPFDSVQLEIGGRVETYWKSMLPSSAAAGHRMTATGGVAGTTAASTQPIASPASQTSGVGPGGSSLAHTGSSSFVTASSLSGDYLRVVVQVTKDGVAVVYPEWTLPLEALDVYVGSVTSEQFVRLAQTTNRILSVQEERRHNMTPAEWTAALSRSMTTLEALLEVLPVSIGIDLDIMYPSTAEIRSNPSLPKIEVNHFVDTVLHTVYAAGTQSRQQSRKIIFSSLSPTVCTALNWKQPNYAVFFASYCGISRTASAHGALSPTERQEPDTRRQSISEAVRFAKSNNFLGIMVDAIILNQVPQLIPSIKAAGLLLITLGQHASLQTATATATAPDGVPDDAIDGFVDDGLVRCRG